MWAFIERAAVAGCLLAAALQASPTLAAGAPPDLDALVSYETRQVLTSGVTRVDSWKERLVRRGNQIWTERLRSPASATGHTHETEAEHLGHKHFNAETAAHWLTLGANGKVAVRFVDRERKVVVDIPRAEFGTVGFDGSFDAAASIVPEAVALAMKPVSGGAAAERGQWRGDRTNGWSHRILWSTTQRIALKLESQRDDGSVRRLVLVQVRAVRGDQQPAPWDQLSDYSQKRYDDFMD